MDRQFIFFQKPKSIEKRLKELREKHPRHWEQTGEKKVLRLFHFAARAVPAYQNFLQKNGIRPDAVKTIRDFQKLPLIDKESFLKKYEYRDLFPNRDITAATTISATSGSTGDPFYFPRGEEQDWQYEYVAELFLKNQWEIDKKSTLCVLGFGLGIWIGGLFTYKNFNKIAQKGYRLSLIPAGPHKEFFCRAIKRFGGFFDQIILAGYPPFIKDIINDAKDYGAQLSDYSLKILTATETFSEEFRTYLSEHAGIKNPLTDIINIYGTVEMGTMAHEMPLTTLIRKIAVNKKEVFEKIFGASSRLPTLAQYYPETHYFEEKDGEVIGSGYGSSIPLIRYRFLDRGGVIPYEEMLKRLKEAGVDILAQAKEAGILDTIFKLPFVYAYERSDMSATLYGITLYPEYIRSALQRRKFAPHLTGKFTMITKTDRKQNQFLQIVIELRKGAAGTVRLKEQAEDAIVQALFERSTEYHHLYSTWTGAYRKRLKPKIIFLPYEHPDYFKPGGKQKWVKK